MSPLSSATATLGGCCEACASTESTALAIACTLDDADFKSRVSTIRDLAGRSLLMSERGGLSLHLTYGPEAQAAVEALAAEESKCCAFLDFVVTKDGAGVHLFITAPVEARAAADELFAHFARELAREAA